MMSGILTILNCGTSYGRNGNSDGVVDIVGELAKKNHLCPTKDLGRRGGGNNPWFINAGPGGGEFGVDQPGTNDYYVGKIKHRAKFSKIHKLDFSGYKVEYKIGATSHILEIPSYEGNILRAINDWGYKTFGPMAGRGMAYNVDRALIAVDYLRARGVINKIVLAGWSRGAVTCHMIANALSKNKNMANIPVSIFAFDPVIGGNPNMGKILGADLGFFYGDKNRNSVPKNVKRYFAIYAGHEARYHYKPVQFKKENFSHFDAIVMPGAHKTMVVRDNNVPEVWEISKALCHQFLIEEGVMLRKPYKLTKLETLKRYDKIMSEKSSNYLKKQRGREATDFVGALDKGVFSKKRDFKNYRGDRLDFAGKASSESPYLVNKHNKTWEEKSVTAPTYAIKEINRKIYQFITGKNNIPLFVNEHHERLFKSFIPIGVLLRPHHHVILKDCPNVLNRLRMAKIV